MNRACPILLWKGPDGRNFRFPVSENVVRIGQRSDCDVLLPNKSGYADEIFAVIKPVKSLEEWQIIPASLFVGTYVNGSPVEVNHYLKSGDRITFSETRTDILFEIRKGDTVGEFRSAPVSRKSVALVSCASAVVLLLTVFGVIAPNLVQKRNVAILKAAEQSVMQLTVDSLYYVRDVLGVTDTIRCESTFGQRGLLMNGTAFLSDEGQLITARHCIEPWLNIMAVSHSAVLDDLPLGTVWAIEAETYNQTHRNDTSFRVVSKCTLHSTDGYEGTFLSSDFRYDNSRDEIVEIGDYSHRYFMRSITGRFNRSDMMLGDLAVLPLHSRSGTIAIPSDDILKKSVISESVLSFKGYPTRQESGIETYRGYVLKDYEPGHMVSHNGGLEPGYSGGPALFVYRGKAYAAGVISTFDKDSRHCIYSVPTSEIKNIPGL